MKYYCLEDDMYFPKRWYLGDVNDDQVDNWAFEINVENVSRDIEYYISPTLDGNEKDYTISTPYCVLIVSDTIKNALEGFDEVEFLPVVIKNKKVKKDYFIFLIKEHIECVDEEKSKFQKYVENDPVRPDRAGEYSAFFKLIIDPKKANGHHIFRVKKHTGAVIISEEVKRRFEEAGVNGIELALVTET